MGIQINGQTDTISASDGGLAVSGYELTGASNINVTGIVTTSQLNVGTGGTVITTTASGLVGINSTSPAFPLDCDQASSVFSFRSTSGSKEIKIGANDPEVISVGAPLYLTAPASQDLILRAGGAERVRVGSAGTMTLRASGGAFIEGYNADDNKLDVAKLSRMGYSTTYRNLIIGKHLPNSTSYTFQSLSLNYDPNTNSGGQFSGFGNEIIVPNNTVNETRYTTILQPNSANTDFNKLVRFGPDGEVLLPSQPAFYYSGQVSLSSTWESHNYVINTNSPQINQGNHFLNGVFTAPVAGTYIFGSAMLSNATSGSYLLMTFYKNTTSWITNGWIQQYDAAPTSNSKMIDGHVIITLSANDTVRTVFHNAYQPIYPTAYNYMWGYLLG